MGRPPRGEKDENLGVEFEMQLGNYLDSKKALGQNFNKKSTLFSVLFRREESLLPISLLDFWLQRECLANFVTSLHQPPNKKSLIIIIQKKHNLFSDYTHLEIITMFIVVFLTCFFHKNPYFCTVAVFLGIMSWFL